MPQTYYTLEASYKLRGVRASNNATLRIKAEEQDLLSALISIARANGHRGRLPVSGLNADNFGYDFVSKRREVAWNFRSSRQARSAEKKMKQLRRNFRRMGLRTKVTTFSEKEESLNEGKKYSITAGQYKSLIKGGHVRECSECNQCVPKYRGRYPSKCSGCGGAVGMPIDEDEKDLKALKRRLKTGAKIGGAVHGAASALRGAGKGLLKGGPIRMVGQSALSGAWGATKGAAGGAGLGAVYHAIKTKNNHKKVKESLIVDENIMRSLSVGLRRKAGRLARVTGKALHAKSTGNVAKGLRNLGTKTAATVTSTKLKGFQKRISSFSPSKRTMSNLIGDSIGALVTGRPLGYVIDELLQDKVTEGQIRQ